MRVRFLPGLVAVLGVVLLVAGACAGTTGRDVVGADEAATTTALGAGVTSTTGVPQVTVPKPGSTGAGEPVTIAFGGDIHYDGALAQTLETAPDTMLAGVADALATADLAVVNLETAIADGGERQSKAFTFTASPAAFASLRAGGADVVSMANNHGMDYGPTGLEQSLAAAAEHQMPLIGVGRDEDEAFRPFTAEVRGQRIAIIAATQVLDSNLIAAWTATATQPGVASAKRVDRLVQAVADARGRSDTVVVFLHWGTEKATCPTDQQIELATQLRDAGADVIVGGHAHRVLGGGYLGDAYVHYGLGNLQFKAGSAEARESGILVVTVTGRRVDGAQWRPAQIGKDYLPRLLADASAEAAVARWESRRACTQLSPTPPGAPPDTPTTP